MKKWERLLKEEKVDIEGNGESTGKTKGRWKAERTTLYW